MTESEYRNTEVGDAPLERPTFDELEGQLRNYLEGAEVGSAKLLALSDLADKYMFQRAARDYIRIIEGIEENKDGTPQYELKHYRRIEEQKVAIVEARIEERKASIEGYASHSKKIHGFFMDLSEAHLIENADNPAEAIGHSDADSDDVATGALTLAREEVVKDWE